jgi:DNA-binding protein HU-beta
MADTTETTHRFFRRQELLASITEKTGLPRPKAIAAMDAMFETLTECLKKGQEVRLVGFGAFLPTERKAGKGRDPRSGAEIDVPESKSVRFKPGKALRAALGGKAAAAAAPAASGEAASDAADDADAADDE